jgi:hypothetical protein
MLFHFSLCVTGTNAGNKSGAEKEFGKAGIRLAKDKFGSRLLDSS